MCLGALVDAGVPWDYLISELQQLAIAEEYQLSQETVNHNGQVATKVKVNLSSLSPPSRYLQDIQTIIETAILPSPVKQASLNVFQQLANAEAAVHGVSPKQVHFHEVGATDAIIDIVGTCLGLHWLGVEQIYCSPLPVGGGTVNASHGQLSVPVPAVMKLWQSRNVPVYSNGLNRELVTPTGAALMVTLAETFGQLPAMTVTKVGLGAGNARLSLPNILRLWIGETQTTETLETVAVLETQIDDLSPQVLAYCQELLLTAGAFDVFTQPIQMKKSRLGVLVTVICPVHKIPACERILFRETTTLGIRRQFQQRNALKRDIQTVTTSLGRVRVKVAFLDNKLINRQPEYEDCVHLAREQNLPLKQVQQVIMASLASLGQPE